MGFYDDEKTARQYIEMAEGYDGAELIQALHAHVPKGATILELGMGPGTDLNILNQSYTVTGSDTSQFFLDEYATKHPKADIIHLDAQHLDTDRVWDCVYSNKVLHHLDDAELENSLARQCKILAENGCIMHSFWRGSGVDEHQGLRFHNRTEDDIRNVVEKEFNILELATYNEMEPDDSIYVIASKK